MSETPARFVWYDLITTDTEAAARFYGEVIGWQAKPGEPPNQHYTMFWMGPEPVAGAMALPEQAGSGPAWLGHIGVDDLEGYVQRVLDAGGHIHRGPTEIPEIGRFAVAADPHGAVFMLFQPHTPMRKRPPELMEGLGQVGWHELRAGDLEADYAFYTGLFGWTSAGDLDMGPSGLYRMFATEGAPGGGMMGKMPMVPAPFWQFYFVVDGVQVTIDRALEKGGKLLMGPQEVPGGAWIAQMLDPQGALFAFTARDR